MEGRPRRTDTRVVSVLVLLALAAVLHVTPATVAPGGSVTISGSGWRPNTPVELRAGPRRSEADRFATVRADANGAFRKVTRLSAHATPGVYVFMGCQRACRTKATALLRVRRRASQSTNRKLPPQLPRARLATRWRVEPA